MIYTIEINSFFCYTGTNIRIQPSVKLIPKKAYKGGMTDEATQISGISGRGTGKQGARTGGLFRDMVRPLPDDGPRFGAAFRRIRGKGENCKGGY